MLRTRTVMPWQVLVGITYSRGDADSRLSRRTGSWMAHIPRENFLEWVLGGKSEPGMNDSILQDFVPGVGYCLGKDP